MGWESKKLRLRRTGFPSWSPLGWENTCEHNRHVMDYLYCSPGFDIEVHLDGSYRHIDLVVSDDQGVQNIAQGSQDLRITAYMSRMTIQSSVNLDSGVDGATLSVGNGQELLLQPRWDYREHPPDFDAFAYCVFHSAAAKYGLIVWCCGDYFERAGVFKVRGGYQPRFKGRFKDLFDVPRPDGGGRSNPDRDGSITRRTFLLR